MKKHVCQIVLLSLFAVSFVFTSCFGGFFEKPDFSSSGRANVRVSAKGLTNGSTAPAAQNSNSRIIAPVPLSGAGIWDTMEVVVKDSALAVIDTTSVTKGQNAELKNLVIGTEYTFEVTLIKNTSDIIATGSKKLTPLTTSSSLEVPVKRVSSEAGVGSFNMSIQMEDFSGIDDMTAELYQRVGATFSPVTAPVPAPFTWSNETGLFTINWDDLSSGSYLLSVIATVQGSLNTLILGDDRLVVINDGCVSQTETGAEISYSGKDILDSSVRYYVSNAAPAEGSNTGRYPNEPLLFDVALNTIYTNTNPLVSESRPARIVLLDSISLSMNQHITGPVHISGLTGNEIISQATMTSMSFLTVGDGMGNSSLTLENISVTGLSGASASLIEVLGDTLILGPGSIISGNTGISAGGIKLTSGEAQPTMRLAGGTITNCSSEDNKGGAIYAEAGTVILESGTISNCSAKFGGGIFISPQAFIERVGTATVHIISNNATVACGGIAVSPNEGYEAPPVPYSALQALSYSSNTATVAFDDLACFGEASTWAFQMNNAINETITIPSFIHVNQSLFGQFQVSVSNQVYIWADPVGTNQNIYKDTASGSAFTLTEPSANIVFSNVTLMADQGHEFDASYILLSGGATCTLQDNARIIGLRPDPESSAVNGLGVKVTNNSTLNIIDSQIVNCYGTGNGGGVFVDSTSRLNLSGPLTLFDTNWAANGAAIYAGSAVNFGPGLVEGFITGNVATSVAGGLYDTGSSPRVKIDGIETEDVLQALKYFDSSFATGNSAGIGAYQSVNWGHIVTLMVEENPGTKIYKPFTTTPYILVQDSEIITAPDDSELPFPEATFTGWHTEEFEEMLWNFETDVVTEDMTLYAQFRGA